MGSGAPGAEESVQERGWGRRAEVQNQAPGTQLGRDRRRAGEGGVTQGTPGRGGSEAQGVVASVWEWAPFCYQA